MTRLIAFGLVFLATAAFSEERPTLSTPPGWQVTAELDGKNSRLVFRGPATKVGRRPVATIVAIEPNVPPKEVLGALRGQKVKADLQGPQQIALQSGDRTILQWILEGGFLLTVDADGDKGRLKAAKTLASWWQSKGAVSWKQRVGTRGE